MIASHDLHDLSAAFIAMRAGIREERNAAILMNVRQALLEPEAPGRHAIRSAILRVPGLDRDAWRFAFARDACEPSPPLGNAALLRLLVHVCDALIEALGAGEFERALDLADAVHCLPAIIAENKYTVTKSYWKSHLRHYRRKWNRDFLAGDERGLRAGDGLARLFCRLMR